MKAKQLTTTYVAQTLAEIEQQVQYVDAAEKLLNSISAYLTDQPRALSAQEVGKLAACFIGAANDPEHQIHSALPAIVCKDGQLMEDIERWMTERTRRQRPPLPAALLEQLARSPRLMFIEALKTYGEPIKALAMQPIERLEELFTLFSSTSARIITAQRSALATVGIGLSHRPCEFSPDTSLVVGCYCSDLVNDPERVAGDAPVLLETVLALARQPYCASHARMDGHGTANRDPDTQSREWLQLQQQTYWRLMYSLAQVMKTVPDHLSPEEVAQFGLTIEHVLLVAPTLHPEDQPSEPATPCGDLSALKSRVEALVGAAKELSQLMRTVRSPVSSEVLAHLGSLMCRMADDPLAESARFGARVQALFAFRPSSIN